MTPAERAVINAAIRLYLTDDGYLDEIKDAVDALKRDGGCICPTDERIYCESVGCRGGSDLPPEPSAFTQLAVAVGVIAPHEVEAQHDPISGDLIPAGQDAELERMGREMAGGRTPAWHPLTMWHVRPGDRVRPRGNVSPEAEITVTARWWPPTDDARGRGSWHVIPGEKHWDDHVVQHGECVVELNGDGRARFLLPEMEIEILIAPAEVAAIEALGGWEQRP